MAHTIAINPPLRPALSDRPWASSCRTYSSNFFIADPPTPTLLISSYFFPVHRRSKELLIHDPFVMRRSSLRRPASCSQRRSPILTYRREFHLVYHVREEDIYAISHIFRRAPQTLLALSLLYHSRNATECAMTDPESVPFRRQLPANTKVTRLSF